ncbi:protein FD-like isoform X2 [Corylus avellana]|uniref:protein FD-like isoform X2 n=1 Tax=Corylus avellana TaxID=13451 RepID=UPI00286A03F1|nr:protein FD-like isoform X2 [Corylus avellana]
MRTPPGAINNNGGNGNSCSPSTCSSASSPISPSSQVIQTPPSARQFMEEVWKDISLASLRDNSNNTLSSSIAATNDHPSGFCGMIFQDFLPRSTNKVLPTSVETSTFLGSPAPPPATRLSLNSASNFAYLESHTPIKQNPQLPSHASVFTTPNYFVSSSNSPVGALGSSSLFPSYCKKRVQEYGDDFSDRRHKRMIKNRESAARSRARKQAYRTELEVELAHLQEENARLRRQQEEVCLVAATQLPRKRRIHRTLTAPF